MYPSVIDVIPREDYTLFVAFENGEKGVIDMKPMLDFGVFRRISKYETFRRVKVAFDTIEWDCGVAVDPEFVYAQYKTQVSASLENR